VQNRMRIQSTNERKRRWGHLQGATGESTTSGALDMAAKRYLGMAGCTTARATGPAEELMRAAEERGSLTGEEIAEILDTEELPLEYETEWGVGGD